MMKAYKLHPKARKNWRKIALILSIVLLIGAAGALIGVRRLYTENLKPVNVSAHQDVVVAIASGSSLDQIAKNLKKKEVIRADWAFKRYVNSKQLSESLKAGTYKFNTSQDVDSIVQALVNGRVDVGLFTIFPDKRIDEIRAAFIEAGHYSIVEVDAALNPANYTGHPALVDKPAGISLEGFLYPDSFQRVAETSAVTIVTQSLDEMAKALTPDIRAGIARQGIGVYQGLVLASIVEHEVSATNPADRPQVAQVFYRRLKENIPLQSDATAVYGAALAGKADKLTHTQILDFDSSYNTYNHAGLPPTPISNITASSLAAVANPATTNYLYFVSGDDCVTRFSSTVQEHDANVQKYLKKGCGN